MNAIVIRMGEIFMKGQNRPFFLRTLHESLEQAVADRARITSLHGRFLAEVEQADLVPWVARRLACVFGVTSVSPAQLCEGRLESIIEAGLTQMRQAWARGSRTFKVASRRSDKTFPLASPDISREVGQAVAQELGFKGDMTSPDTTLWVEVGREMTFVTSQVIPGPGGLPVGTTGRVLLLLSGGIDSPVAGWLALKRGCRLQAVHFHSPPYTGPASVEKVRELCQALALYQGGMRLNLISMTAIQEAFQSQAPERLAVVLLRRSMLRLAARLSGEIGAGALVTGESIGQVASQTLSNMSTTSLVTDKLIIRPLVTYDKADTIALARKIGTFDVSTRPHQDCCTLFVPPHPATSTRPSAVLGAEAGLGLEELEERAWGERTEEDIEEGRGLPPFVEGGAL